MLASPSLPPLFASLFDFCLLLLSLTSVCCCSLSGMIQIGDILLKVDGKDVPSTEKASELILGPVSALIVR